MRLLGRLAVNAAVMAVLVAVLVTVLTYPRTGVPQALRAAWEDLKSRADQTAAVDSPDHPVAVPPILPAVLAAAPADVKMVAAAQKASEVRIVSGDAWSLEKEQAVFRGINQTRTSQQLPALKWSETVAKVARARAQEMAETQWVGKDGSLRTSGTPADAMRKALGASRATGQEFGCVAIELADDGALIPEDAVTALREDAATLPEGWRDRDIAEHNGMMIRDFEQAGVGVAWMDRPLKLYIETDGKNYTVVAVVVALYRTP